MSKFLLLVYCCKQFHYDGDDRRDDLHGDLHDDIHHDDLRDDGDLTHFRTLQYHLKCISHALPSQLKRLKARAASKFSPTFLVVVKNVLYFTKRFGEFVES